MKWICRNIEINHMWDEFPEISAELRGIPEPGVTDLRDEFNKLNEKLNGYEIKKVIFNKAATIVLWTDGTKTVVKDKSMDYEKSLAMAITKKFFGNNLDTFKRWLNEPNFCR